MSETTSNGAVPDLSKGKIIASFEIGGTHCDLLQDCPTAGADNIPDGLKFHFRFCLLIIEPTTKSLVGVLSHEVSMFGTEAISYMDNAGNRNTLCQASSDTTPHRFLESALDALSKKTGMFSKQEIKTAIRSISVGNAKKSCEEECNQQEPINPPLDPEEMLEKMKKVKKFISDSTDEPSRINKKIIGGFLFLVVGIGSIWYVFSPHNYDDCILKNLKSGMSDIAVVAVKNSCLNKFPLVTSSDEEACKHRSLTADELKLIKGNAHITDHGLFEASIYNGNKDFAISDIVVTVEDVGTGKKLEYKTFGHWVEPLTTERVRASLAYRPAKGFDWSVSSATDFRCEN